MLFATDLLPDVQQFKLKRFRLLISTLLLKGNSQILLSAPDGRLAAPQSQRGHDYFLSARLNLAFPSRRRVSTERALTGSVYLMGYPARRRLFPTSLPSRLVSSGSLLMGSRD
jgi:hypothetical protein